MQLPSNQKNPSGKGGLGTRQRYPRDPADPNSLGIGEECHIPIKDQHGWLKNEHKAAILH